MGVPSATHPTRGCSCLIGSAAEQRKVSAQTDIQALRPTGLCRVGQLLLGAGIQWVQPADNGMAAAQAQD